MSSTKQSLLHLAFAFVVTSGLGACATHVKIPEGPAPVTKSEAEQAWTRVLKTYVNDKGQVDFDGLEKNIGDLETYVRYVAAHDPNNFANNDEKIAFYLNSYNSLSMWNVIKAGKPKALNSAFKRIGFFALRKMPIMGKEMSLYGYENDIIRPQVDARVHVALNCMARSCPRLPNVPFEGPKLQDQLNAAAKAFYNEPRNVTVDDEKKVVFLSEILSFFTKDFLKSQPSLIAYVNQYHEPKVPDGYKVKFFKYDWTINRQE